MKRKDNVSDIRDMINIINHLNESITTNYGNYCISIYDPIESVEDKQYLNEHGDEIWNFMNAGYKTAGEGEFNGCFNIKSLKRNANLFKIAQADTGDWIAVSLYTGYQFGKKCIGITATVKPELREFGKEAVSEIIKADATHPLDFFWCECSGAVAHYMEKHGGVPIRNEFVKEYINQDVIPSSWLNDEYHYTRKLANGKEVTKMIFGFNRKETFDKIYAKYKNEIDEKLGKCKQDFINENNSVDEIEFYDNVLGDFCLYTNELGVQEFPQYYLDIVNHCIVHLKLSCYNDKDVQRIVRNADDVLKYVTPLECRHYVGNESIINDGRPSVLVAENKE